MTQSPLPIRCQPCPLPGELPRLRHSNNLATRPCATWDGDKVTNYYSTPSKNSRKKYQKDIAIWTPSCEFLPGPLTRSGSFPKRRRRCSWADQITCPYGVTPVNTVRPDRHLLPNQFVQQLGRIESERETLENNCVIWLETGQSQLESALFREAFKWSQFPRNRFSLVRPVLSELHGFSAINRITWPVTSASIRWSMNGRTCVARRERDTHRLAVSDWKENENSMEREMLKQL